MVARPESQIRQVEENVRFLQETHHDALVVATRRNRRHTHVDRPARDFEGNTAILWQAFLSDVQYGHDLHTGDHRTHELTTRGARHVELAVHPVANDNLSLLRLDVNIARPLFDSLREQIVYPTNNRRIIV